MPYAHTIEGNPHWLPLNPRRAIRKIPGREWLAGRRQHV